MVISSNGSTFTVTNYQWNTTECYTNTAHNSGNPTCFPTGQTTQNVTENHLTAEDAGTITCTAIIDGVDYTSEPLTLRISGMVHYTYFCTVEHRIFLYSSGIHIDTGWYKSNHYNLDSWSIYFIYLCTLY